MGLSRKPGYDALPVPLHMPLLALILLAAAPQPVTRPLTRALPAGTVAWLSVEVAVSGTANPAKSDLRLLGYDREGPVRLLPHVRLIQQRRGRVLVEVPVLVEATARPASVATARGTVVVDLGSARGRARVERRVRIGPPDGPSAAELRPAYEAWSARAEAARARGEVDPEAEVEVLAALEGLRGRAASDPDARAQLARIELDRPPLSDPSQGRIETRLREAARALARARFAEARDLASSVRKSGHATPDELARSLVLLGVLERLHGHASAASTALGQALCLRPDLPVPDLPDDDLRFVAAARATSTCGRITLAPLDPSWHRDPAGAPELHLPLQVEGDPFHLVTRIEVERFQLGGLPTGRVAEVSERGRAQVLFPTLEEEAGEQVLLRVRLFDAYGNTVLRQGEPEALRLDAGPAPERPSNLGPWWLWAGGALVVVGGVVVAVWAAEQDTSVHRGLGPFTVEF